MINFKDLQEKGICWVGYKRKKGTKPYEDNSCVKEEAEKHHAMAFGRMNPITSGHEAVVNKLHSVAKEHNASHNLVVSHSQDAKKNPLSGAQKVTHAKNAFPKTNVTAASKEAPTILHHAAAAHAAGATHLHVIAGSDRHEEMHNLLHKYNGKDSGHGHYNFKKITVHSSGERDPDAEGTTGISASKMREHAASGNKTAFHAGAPIKMTPKHKTAMYNDVRKGMNIKEETAEQQTDRTLQLKRFKDQISKVTDPKVDTEIALDKKEKSIMTSNITETLRPDMGAGAYVNDFIKSTNPRFNNKSKAERRRMAIGAYMNAKANGVKEDFQIDELSTNLLGKYKTAAGVSAKSADAAGNYVKGNKRFSGINKATNKQFDNDLKNRNTIKEDSLRDHYADSQEHLSKASKALETSDMVSHHGHMADHHDSLSQWHESKGRSAAAQKHADKAEEHAEKYTKLAGGVTEGTIQGNVAGGDTMNTTTSAPSVSTAKDTTMGKKIKEFKFFNGENDKQMNMNQPVKEEKKDDVPFDGPYKSNFKKPNNPNRTGMDSARSLAQRAMDQVNTKKPVKEEVEQIDELSKSTLGSYVKKASDSATMHAFGAGGESQRHAGEPISKRPDTYGADRRVALKRLKGIGKATDRLTKEEAVYEEVLDVGSTYKRLAVKHLKDSMAKSSTTTQKNYAKKMNLRALEASKMNNHTDALNHYRGIKEDTVKEQYPVAPTLDRKYIRGTPEHKAYKALRKPINGHPTNVKEETLDENHRDFAQQGKMHPDMAKHMKTGQEMDFYHSKTGDKISGVVKHVSGSEVHIKAHKDGKMGAGEVHKFKVSSILDEAITQKGINVDKVNSAGQEPHEENFETVKKPKLKKEEIMKSYKDFLQSLEEKLIGKQKKLDKNHNGEVDAQDFKMLRKEEVEQLDEYESDESGVYRNTKKATYGTTYNDPDGADETAAGLKKKTAGRKAGQSTGSYKPRKTMSKLKSAGSTYK